MRLVRHCVVLHLILHWALFLCRASCLSVDGVALITFKQTLSSDPSNALGTWNASNFTPCAWNGVKCSALNADNTARVVSLELIGKGLGGIISPALGALSSLQTLKLQGNSFNGSLPSELFKASSLQMLLLGGNRITGALPPQIGNLINLKFLDVSSNAMLGTVPESLTRCTQLQSLVLARNLFSGHLPDGLAANLKALEQLDLSSNLFSGPIPAGFGKLSALQGTLNLSYNHLSGGIPLSLGELPYTVSLDLSHNNLSGRIPQDGSLSEQGPGPFLNNPGLCGFPLSAVCPVTPFLSPLPSLPTEASSQSSLNPQTGDPTTPRNTTKKPNLSVRAIIAITFGDAAGVLLMASLFVYLYWKTRGCKKMDSSPSCVGKDLLACISTSKCLLMAHGSEKSDVTSAGSEEGEEQGKLVALDKDFCFDIDELLRASAFVLGKSGTGIVYKVVLGNGTPVAVRRIGEEGGLQKRKDFETEVRAIRKLRHPNVVRLLAYYWANEEKLLIHEFISHGTLASALLGHSQLPSKTLTWEERLRLAQGVARGLAYLHECSPRKYVHGDIKTTKILLDGSMHPYIADFGLARLSMMAGVDETTGTSGSLSHTYSASEWSGPQTGSSARHVRSMSRAPEAMSNAKPAQKWDVYGFGVVLMELIGGRARALEMAAGGVDFVGCMRKAAEEEEVDRVLDTAIAPTTAHAPSAASLLNLAVACTHLSPDHRPKMRSVAECLDKLILQTCN